MSADKKAQELHSGDVVNIPANVMHWHGAAKDWKPVKCRYSLILQAVLIWKLRIKRSVIGLKV